MANSKGRCAGCRDYFLREQLTMIGLQGVCSDDCKRTLLDKHKLKVQRRSDAKTRTRKRGMSTDLRRRVCRRDKKVCRICGHMRYRMEVHHIQFRSQGGADHLSNLILLCSDCHSACAHGIASKFYRSLFRAYVWLRSVEGKDLFIPEIETLLGWEQLFKHRELDPNTGCWLWTGSKTKVAEGYGRLKLRGCLVLTHRLAYENTFGPVPSGMKVLHRCDVPACFNPDHLFLGTQGDNVADMHKKDRANKARGERVARSKLTAAQIDEIRAKRSAGATAAALASEYGCNASNISHICTGRTWNHVPQ